MMAFSFRKLRQRDVAIIVLVVTALLAGVWYLYMYRPTLERIQVLEDDATRLDLEVVRGEAALRNLPTLREEVAALELERLAFLAELPLESDVAGLLQQVRQSAEASDVTISQLSQGSVSESLPDVRPISFDVATNGNYADTMQFLMSLEDLQRYTKIRQVGLSRGGAETEEDPELTGNFSMTVYVYTGTDPGQVNQ